MAMSYQHDTARNKHVNAQRQCQNRKTIPWSCQACPRDQSPHNNGILYVTAAYLTGAVSKVSPFDQGVVTLSSCPWHRHWLRASNFTYPNLTSYTICIQLHIPNVPTKHYVEQLASQQRWISICRSVRFSSIFTSFSWSETGWTHCDLVFTGAHVQTLRSGPVIV